MKDSDILLMTNPEKLQNEIVAAQMKARIETAASAIRAGLIRPEAFMIEPLELRAAEQIAELSKQGQHATARVVWTAQRSGTVFRIQLRLPDGRIENVKEDREMPFNPDPSDAKPAKPDHVNHPPHYASHPSGVECVDIAEHLSFNLGNALKYVWRWEQKDDPEENLRKCLWYIERETSRLDQKIEIHMVARAMIQKTIRKEDSSTLLCKFLVILDERPVHMYGKLKTIVQEELRKHTEKP